MRVEFTEQDHRYTDTETGQDYISVTTLIERYVPPFETEYWATYKAIKDVLSQAGIWYKYKKLAGGWQNVVAYHESHPTRFETAIHARKADYISRWEQENRVACELGTERHKEKEIEVLGQTEEHTSGHPSHSGDIDKFESIENGIFAELLIYDAEFHIAGQVDYVRKTDKHIWISDYKTCKKISNESFMDKRMLPPLNELYDTNFNHYMMQLSTYGYLLERRGFIVEGLDLLHIDRESGEHQQTIELPYRPDLVVTMIEDYTGKAAHYMGVPPTAENTKFINFG